MRKLSVFKLFLLMVCTIFLIAACSRNSLKQTVSNGDNTTSNAHPTAVKVVKHAFGETKVPLNPQRVVVLNYPELDHALGLGVKPVGGPSVEDVPLHLRDKLKGIENIGTPDGVSLEKILTLKPDLILSNERSAKPIYQMLSGIAPTVVGIANSGEWKQDLKLFATALNQTEQAEKFMENYYARLNELQAQMGKKPEQIEVSVVRISPENITLYLEDSFCGTILQDAGLQRPPAQDLDTSILARKDRSVSVSISSELLHQADGDVMFLWGWSDDADSRQALQQLKANPLWSKLNVVQQSKVYQVPDYWIGSGPLAANAVIEDLFKYLVLSHRSD